METPGVDGKTYVSTPGIQIPSGTSSSTANYFGTNGSTVYTISADLTTFTNKHINLGGGGVGSAGLNNGGNGLLNSANNTIINNLGGFLGGGGGGGNSSVFNGGKGGAGGGGGGGFFNLTAGNGGSIITILNGGAANSRSGAGGGASNGLGGTGNGLGGRGGNGYKYNNRSGSSGGNGGLGGGGGGGGGYGGNSGGSNTAGGFGGGGGGGGGIGRTGAGAGGYGIQNDGSISSLVNVQGSSLTSNYLYGPLFFSGNAPDSYKMQITDENTFGQLWCTGVGNPSPKTISNFSVQPSESFTGLLDGIYNLSNVLLNVIVPVGPGSSGLPSSSFTSGNKTYTWSLVQSSSTVNAYNLDLSVSTDEVPCFVKGTKILTNKGYVKIEDLNKDEHLVETFLHGLKEISMIGNREIYHAAKKERIKDQVYICEKENYPELIEDLLLTGAHGILINRDFKSSEEKEKTIEVNGDTYVTDGLYRLPACVDERTSVYEKEGKYRIYHLALENSNYYENYGIYANGLLVESCSKRYLKELSGMEM